MPGESPGRADNALCATLPISRTAFGWLFMVLAGIRSGVTRSGAWTRAGARIVKRKSGSPLTKVNGVQSAAEVSGRGRTSGSAVPKSMLEAEALTQSLHAETL
jgi:hypothetical protein